jgi:hypothetical protein
MIEHDEMAVDVRDFICREIVLSAGETDVLLAGYEDVRPHGQVLQVVGQRVLRAAAVAANVVEGRVDRHETELSFVEVVPVDAEVVVLGERQMGCELMRESYVPGVVGFRERRSNAGILPSLISL